MAGRRVLVCLLGMVIVGSGCRGEEPPPMEPPGGQCPHTLDLAEPRITPLVKVRPPGSRMGASIRARTKLTCATRVRVDERGATDLFFGSTALCQLTEHDPDRKDARAVTRDPLNVLLRLQRGRLHCTAAGQRQPISLCGMGALLPSAIWQGRSSCDRDPLFQVASFRGPVQVREPGGTRFGLTEGEELTFDFRSGELSIGSAAFSAEEVALFQEQAESLGIEPDRMVSPTPSPTPSPTTEPSPPSPPFNIAPPTVDWVTFQKTVVGNPGEWTGTEPIGFDYQWQGGCNADGQGCLDVPGANELDYDVRYDEDCNYVRVVVTATNQGGTAVAFSSPFFITCIG